MKIKHKGKDLQVFIDAVLNGDLKVGEVIRQKDLCEVLQTSISPLRETLVLLEDIGLIEVKARAGIKVVYPDIAFMRDNLQFRIMIEKNAVRLFCKEVSDTWIEAQIEAHESMLEALENSDNSSELGAKVVTMDRGFHAEIVAALNNAEISKAHEYIQTKLRIARQVHRRVPPRQINIGVMNDHLAILRAMKSRDSEAVEKALDAHFTMSSHNTLVGY